MTTAFSWILALAGGFLLLRVLTPSGTEIDEDTISFSGEERLSMFIAVGVLVALIVLMRAAGIDQDTDLGRVVLGPLGFAAFFLLFGAVFGGEDRAP